MYKAREPSYVSGVGCYGIVGTYRTVFLCKYVCWVGVYCAVAVTRAAMTGKRPRVLLIMALPREGEKFVVVVP